MCSGLRDRVHNSWRFKMLHVDFTNLGLASLPSHHKVVTFSKIYFNKRVLTPSGLSFSAATVRHHALAGIQIEMLHINTCIIINRPKSNGI